jgi:hypothetical protein
VLFCIYFDPYMATAGYAAVPEAAMDKVPTKVSNNQFERLNRVFDIQTEL